MSEKKVAAPQFSLSKETQRHRRNVDGRMNTQAIIACMAAVPDVVIQQQGWECDE